MLSCPIPQAVSVFVLSRQENGFLPGPKLRRMHRHATEASQPGHGIVCVILVLFLLYFGSGCPCLPERPHCHSQSRTLRDPGPTPPSPVLENPRPLLDSGHKPATEPGRVVNEGGRGTSRPRWWGQFIWTRAESTGQVSQNNSRGQGWEPVPPWKI